MFRVSCKGEIVLNHSSLPEPIDAETFEALFHQYKNLVYRVALLILDDRHEAEDALQEVFLLVFRSYHTYDPAKGAVTTWLYRITVNHCLKRRRKQKFLMVSLDSVFFFLSPHPPSMLDEYADKDEIEQAMARLGDSFRIVLILRYFLDLSYDEISQVLQIPLGTVKSRLTRALKILQREIRKERSKLMERNVAE